MAYSELFFSEYVEGSGKNQALEIYNGTGQNINLASQGFVVQFYNNGSTVPITINLTGILKNDDVFCLSRSSASFSLLAYCDQINSSSAWFDGNDAIVLRKGGANGQIVDSLGQIGSADYWGVDTTLRRKKSITGGDAIAANSFDKNLEWNSSKTDSFTDIGTYYSAPVLTAASVKFFSNEDEQNNLGTLVSDLIKGAIADKNKDDALGIAVTQTSNLNGAWQYSLNGTDWSNFSVTPASSILLGGTARIRFVADVNYFGSLPGAIAFRAWDGSEGFNGQTGVNPGIGGGIAAYSTTTAVVDAVVRNVNDAPSFTIGGNQSVRVGTSTVTVAGWAYDFFAGALNESNQAIAGFEVENLSYANYFKEPVKINSFGDLIYSPVSSSSSGFSLPNNATFRARVRDNGGTDAGGVNISEWKYFSIYLTTASSLTMYGRFDGTYKGTDQADYISSTWNVPNIIYGGIGSDNLIGYGSDDILYGDLEVIPAYALNPANNFTFDDSLTGGAGNDVLYGQLGNDKLYGNAGDDILYGGDGNDELWGTTGLNTYFGGSGSDLFAALRLLGSPVKSEVDVINDFQDGVDYLGSGYLWSQITLLQQGSDLLLAGNSGSYVSKVLIKNFSAANFSSADIRSV